MTVQVVRGGAAPDALYLIGYVFDRDYFDSQPNVRRWLADHGLVAAELRRRPFAFYVPVREIAPGYAFRTTVEVASGVSAVYGVPG